MKRVSSFLLAVSCLASPAWGRELAVAVANGAEAPDVQAALERSLREHGDDVVGLADVKARARADAVHQLLACSDDACVLEFAGALGLERAVVARVGADYRLGFAVVVRNQPSKTNSAAWDGNAAALSTAVKSGLASILAAPAPVASAPARVAPDATPAPTVTASAVAPKVEILEPPANDLRGRVRTLAKRLHDGYLAAGTAGPIHRVAILDFDAIGADAARERLGSVVAEILLSEIAGMPGTLVVERSKLKELVSELKLQGTADMDPRTATEIGRFLGAGSMIVGSVSEAGAEYVLNARQVSVETAAVINAASVSVDRGELVALSKDLVEIKSATGAALRSAVLPGWGQIYNGDTGLGAVFLGAGVGSAAAAGSFAVLYKANSDRYHKNGRDDVPFREKANRYGSLANVMLGAYGLVWALNIAHAYFTGRDGTSVRSPSTAADGAMAASF